MHRRKKSVGILWRVAAAAIVVTAIAVLHGQVFTFSVLQPGFSQTVVGTTRSFLAKGGYLGGVAVLQNGNVIAAECQTSSTRLHIFDASVTDSSGLHPETIVATPGGCGIALDPTGHFLYANMNDNVSGVATIDLTTFVATRLGPPGNALGIAVDPVTGHVVYPGKDCKPLSGSPSTCTLFELDPASPPPGAAVPLAVFPASQTGYIDGVAFDPTGAYIFLTNRYPPSQWALVVLDRAGNVLQRVPMTSEPVGVGIHAVSPKFVLTNNQDGTMTRLDFPADNYAAVPTQTVFANGGFRGDLMQAGPDGCLYVTQDGLFNDQGDPQHDNSITRICGDFAIPPGVTPTPPPPSRLCGSVFLDVNNNGIDDGTVDVPIGGVTLTLTGSNYQAIPVSLSTATGTNGGYCFDNLRPGTYSITELQPAGYFDGKDSQGTPGTGTAGNDAFSNIVLAAGVDGQNNNFAELLPSSLCGFVYSDANNDGLKNTGEAGVGSAAVTLTGTDDLGAPVTLPMSTGADGGYCFNSLRPGTYTIAETQPSGYLDGKDKQGTPGTGTAGNDVFANIVLKQNVNGQNNNFGEIAAAPAISLVKKTNGTDNNSLPGRYVPTGSAVTWTYVVTNTGNDVLSTVAVTDDRLGAITCASTTLAVGATMTCSATGTAVAGQYVNIGTVTAQDQFGQTVTASNPEYYFGSTPGIALVTKTNGTDNDTAPGLLVAAGSPVTWTYILTNTGNTALSSITVSDNKLGGISCPATTVAVGATMTCTKSGTAIAGQYTNTGTVTAKDPAAQSVTASNSDNYFGTSPSISIVNKTNGSDNNSAPGLIVPTGTALTWTYLVTNTGNMALTAVALTDDKAGAIGCAATALTVGGSMTCSATGVAPAGQYTNIGTVTGMDATLKVVSASNPEYVFGASPAVALVKTTNNTDNDTGTGPMVPVGAAVTWRYLVTNTGNVTLSGVAVTDDKAGAISCPASTVAVGATLTCTKTGTAIAGQYTNIGTVTAKDPTGKAVAASNPDNYFGTITSIAIGARTNGTDNDTAPGLLVPTGSAVTWTYLVTNTGNVPLSSVGVTDNKIGVIGCPTSTLAVGASVTCTAVGTAVAGQYTNVGTATGTDAAGKVVTASNPDNYFGASPAIALIKKTNGSDNDTGTGPLVVVGSTVTWSYVVTNTGNVSLSSVGVTDDKLGAITCPASTLAIGATLTCTKSGGALVTGQYTNVGTATGTDGTGKVVAASNPDHYFGINPSISLVKKTNGTNNDIAPGPVVPMGNPITWTYLVTNTGDVALSTIAVTDNKLGAITCPTGTLAVGASLTCTATGTAVAGQYTNIGTVTAKAPNGFVVSASNPDNYFGATPAVSLVTKTNGVDSDSAPGVLVPTGSLVSWTYLVTNTGNVPLSVVTLTDNKIGTIGCEGPTIAVGASLTCTATGTALSGQYTNIGTVTATDVTGKVVTASNGDNYFGASPAITLVKKTNGTDNDVAPGPMVVAGSTVTWTYVLTNTGNVVLSGIALTDDKAGAIGCPDTTLAAGTSLTCTKTGTAITGGYMNIGTVTAKDGTGRVITASNPDNYFGINPSVAIVKKTNGTDNNSAPGPVVPMGSPVTWSYQVTNTGDVPLSAIAVTDNKIGAIVCPDTKLAVRDTFTCRATGTAVAGQYTNIGTATAQAPNGYVVTASNPDNYFGANPSMSLVLKTNGTDNDSAPGLLVPTGSPITWTYLVANTGNVPLSAILVLDNKVAAISCPATTLAVGASLTCTAAGTAVSDQFTNIGRVTAIDSTGKVVTASNPDNYFGASPAVALITRTNGTDNDAPTGPMLIAGTAVTWTYVVTNLGNVPLSGLGVTDNKVGAISCPASVLAVGASVTCARTGTAIVGQYTNIATVTAKDGTGQTITASNPDNYFGINPSIAIVTKTNGTDNNSAPGPVLPMGSPVSWTYVVTNTGDVALSAITVVDDKIGVIDCVPTKLAVAASMTCTATGIAVAGQYSNIGTVTAKAPTGYAITASNPDNYFGGNPAISLVKKTNGTDNDSAPGLIVAPGSAVTWSYLLANTGNVPLLAIAVTDNKIGVISCPAVTLGVGASLTCTKTGTAIAGQYTNIGTVTAKDAAGKVVTASNSDNYFGATPSVTIVNKTNGSDNDTAPGPIVAAGSTVIWNYVVTNSGDIGLSSVIVTDNKLGTVSCPGTTLAVGASLTCTATGTAVAGQYTNIAAVTAKDATGRTVTASNPDNYFGTKPAITLVTKTNGVDSDVAPGVLVPAGSPVTWTFYVANTGNVALSGIALTDTRAGVITCPSPTLASGAGMTCTATGVAISGQYTDIGTVSARDTIGTIVTAANSDNYFGVSPAFTFVTMTNGTDNDSGNGPTVLAGSTVTWTYGVTNTGNVALSTLTVTDDKAGTVTCPATTLLPSDSITCTKTGIALEGQYTNVGTGTAKDPLGRAITASNTDHYFGVKGPIVNGIARFVALSSDYTFLGDNTIVHTGDVGANTPRVRKHDHRRVSDYDQDDLTVWFDEGATMQQPNSRVVGDTVRLDAGASIYNLIDNGLMKGSLGKILGTVTHPMASPFLTMPAFPVVTEGTQDVTVRGTRTLAPGSYGDIHVPSGATLILSGGLYQMDTLDLEEQATVIVRGASELRIEDDLDGDNRVRFIVDPTVPGLKASNVVIYVQGSDDRCRHDFGGYRAPTIVEFGNQSVIQANIYAPEGTIRIGASSTATGAFIGQHVVIGDNSALTLDSAFK